MGQNEDGFPMEGICASWQPVSVFSPQENSSKEIYDCSIFGWPPDLLTEVAKEACHGAASSDKVATEVAKFHATSLGVMNEDAQQRLITTNPRLLPSLPPETGNGSKMIEGG